ncbi:hypothetical protein B0A48_16731 [Cryoendolithus antarcticus]|uniref:Uncharacterized protein n=1 Tax=Cryoendolithus antarcticus TaxID=1507870 RepID=A0A1V8SE13_9PEZI|nr:hypothetical protein B0A48_16731 [Cryoendolithus antarcticus]
MPAARSTATGKRKRTSATPILSDACPNIINAEADDAAGARKKRATPSRVIVKQEILDTTPEPTLDTTTPGLASSSNVTGGQSSEPPSEILRP